VITIINGSVQALSGVACPNGSVVFSLNMDAQVKAAPGGQVLASQATVFQFDSMGQLVQPAQLYSNVELNPQNATGVATYYLVTFYDANGARINLRPMWWIFPNPSGSTVDISQMTPLMTLPNVGGNIIYYPTAFAATMTRSIQFVIDGRGSVPAPGSLGQISIPCGATIIGWTITADQSGSAVLDVLRSSYSAFPTTASIAGIDKPTLSGAQKNTDSTLTGWGSTALNAGDELQISLSSISGCTRLNLSIAITVP
jgi:hypothetical protein